MRATAADWGLLNAYVDGELSPGESAALEARLRDDAELRRAHNRIRSVKRELAALRPSAAMPEPIAPDRGHPVVRRAAAVAAAVVIAGGLIAAFVLWRPEQATWLAEAEALHNALSHKAYVVEERHTVQLVSSGTALEFHAPDLTESHLYLVDVATGGGPDSETIALHYRGMRGCRLTVVAIEAADEDAEMAASAAPVDGTLSAAWTHRGFHFAVIAQGMDRERFRSVAEYTRTAIAESTQAAENLRVAMADRYRDAQPCA